VSKAEIRSGRGMDRADAYRRFLSERAEPQLAAER
jgi:hypothetical protein